MFRWPLELLYTIWSLETWSLVLRSRSRLAAWRDTQSHIRILGFSMGIMSWSSHRQIWDIQDLSGMVDSMENLSAMCIFHASFTYSSFRSRLGRVLLQLSGFFWGQSLC